MHPWGADRARLLGIERAPDLWERPVGMPLRPRSVPELMEHYPQFTRKEAQRVVFLMYLVATGRVG